MVAAGTSLLSPKPNTQQKNPHICAYQLFGAEPDIFNSYAHLFVFGARNPLSLKNHTDTQAYEKGESQVGPARQSSVAPNTLEINALSKSRHTFFFCSNTPKDNPHGTHTT